MCIISITNIWVFSDLEPFLSIAGTPVFSSNINILVCSIQQSEITSQKSEKAKDPSLRKTEQIVRNDFVGSLYFPQVKKSSTEKPFQKKCYFDNTSISKYWKSLTVISYVRVFNYHQLGLIKSILNN